MEYYLAKRRNSPILSIFKPILKVLGDVSNVVEEKNG